MGKRYLKQGHNILLSRRIDAYLMDTFFVCLTIPFVFVLCFHGKSAVLGPGLIEICGLLGLMVLLLCGRLLEKTCAFYHDQAKKSLFIKPRAKEPAGHRRLRFSLTLSAR